MPRVWVLFRQMLISLSKIFKLLVHSMQIIIMTKMTVVWMPTVCSSCVVSCGLSFALVVTLMSAEILSGFKIWFGSLRKRKDLSNWFEFSFVSHFYSQFVYNLNFHAHFFIQTNWYWLSELSAHNQNTSFKFLVYNINYRWAFPGTHSIVCRWYSHTQWDEFDSI